MMQFLQNLSTGIWWLDIWLSIVLVLFSLMAYRRWLKGELKWGGKIIACLPIAVLAVLDCFLNFTLFRFMGPAPKGTWSISERFEDYRAPNFPAGFRKTVANVTCWILDQFDPLHC